MQTWKEERGKGGGGGMIYRRNKQDTDKNLTIESLNSSYFSPTFLRNKPFQGNILMILKINFSRMSDRIYYPHKIYP